MPTRSTPPEYPDEPAKLAVLRQAARSGLDALAEGRYYEISDSELDDFIRDLGRQASESLREMRRKTQAGRADR